MPPCCLATGAAQHTAYCHHFGEWGWRISEYSFSLALFPHRFFKCLKGLSPLRLDLGNILQAGFCIFPLLRQESVCSFFLLY